MDRLNPIPAGSERSEYAEPHPYRSRRQKPTRSAGQCEDSPTGIPPLHGQDGVDEFSVWTLGAGSTPALGRKSQAVLAFHQEAVQMELRGGLQDDGGEDAWLMNRVNKPAVRRP